MREQRNGRSLSGLAALLLLGLFAAGILLVLLQGAGAYRRLTARDRAAYDTRTCTQYLATKVRQAPTAEAVTLRDFSGADCLVIGEQIDGARYCTRIYCHDGWLMELFTLDTDGFAPEDGERILPAQALALTLTDSLLRAEITGADGAVSEVVLRLRGGEGAGA